jgi:hypothetical protein
LEPRVARLKGDHIPEPIEAKPTAKRPRKKARPKPDPAKRFWTFPKQSLEAAIRVAKAIEEKNAGNPMPARDLAVAVGFRQPQDWCFLDLLRSANQYGLVSGTGPAASIDLTQLGQDVVSPSSPAQQSQGLLNAFRTVKDFVAVENYYGGKPIPEDEFFLNTVIREFGIPRERVDVFAKVFRDNLDYLRAFSTATAASEPPTTASEPGTAPGASDKNIRVVLSKEPRSREFLDTRCVMMPFGEWFDKYYQDIYTPAIKDAGFEPVRADELFTTGSVVKQIWEQIEKAKLLLADLTNKIPNVFYELGLAHAAGKPVIFAAAHVDDVPFDLRHLRVIIYDIREPEWASKLRTNVTDYLRNASKDPEKSIPHPFRNSLEAPSQPTKLTRR